MREMSEHKGRTEEVIKEVVNANDDLAASIAIEQENIAEKQATLNQIEGDTLALSEEHKRLDAFRSVLDSKLHTMRLRFVKKERLSSVRHRCCFTQLR